MFTNDSAARFIPGYTGHIPSQRHEGQAPQVGPGYHIPSTAPLWDAISDNLPHSFSVPFFLGNSDYAGFVSGIKAENMFGRTYGDITSASRTGTVHRGLDLPPELRYSSECQSNYINQMDKGRDYVFRFAREDNYTPEGVSTPTKTNQFLPFLSKTSIVFEFHINIFQHKRVVELPEEVCGMFFGLGKRLGGGESRTARGMEQSQNNQSKKPPFWKKNE